MPTARTTSLRLALCAVALVPACAENVTPAPTATPTPPLGCLPDLDGTLTAAEVPVVLGVPLAYKLGGHLTVDIARAGRGGPRRWGWSGGPKSGAGGGRRPMATIRTWGSRR